jgi:hypothetical protein
MSIEITESKLAKFHELMSDSGWQATVTPKDVEEVAKCLIRANIVNHYSDDLTAAYMAGVENGKHRSELKIKKLQQENESLRNVVRRLIDKTLKQDEEGEIK